MLFRSPEMVVVPSGSFTMGSPASETGTYDEERPLRTVTVRKFAVGKFVITRAQWAEFVAATNRPTVEGCEWSFLPKGEEAKASWRHLGFTQDDSHPAVCVSWQDAQDYLAWLSKRAGRKYRLLSESEWEYASRAGSKTAYPWGSKADHEHLNYGGEKEAGVGLASGRDKWVYTSPVGSFPPNAFGLYDMNGNVLQWVQDCFSSTYAGLPTDGSAYQSDVLMKGTGYFASMNGKRSCEFRMLRGGDCADPPLMVRSASRNWAPPPGETLQNYKGTSGLGIRVARDLD